jgi:hypothetical protein
MLTTSCDRFPQTQPLRGCSFASSMVHPNPYTLNPKPVYSLPQAWPFLWLRISALAASLRSSCSFCPRHMQTLLRPEQVTACSRERCLSYPRLWLPAIGGGGLQPFADSTSTYAGRVACARSIAAGGVRLQFELSRLSIEILFKNTLNPTPYTLHPKSDNLNPNLHSKP